VEAFIVPGILALALARRDGAPGAGGARASSPWQVALAVLVIGLGAGMLVNGVVQSLAGG
jgi:hypothetical protein